MKNITYYNAGAGSGKTHALTHKLAELVEKGLKPSQVILTTFTVKAAEDLKERARAVLYEKGLNQQAVTLDQATIGTVHSIGQKFISRFWYLLGLSPNMKVMDDNSTNYYISQSLSTLASVEDLDAFNHFRNSFNITKSEGGFGSKVVSDYDYWKNWLRSIIEKCVSYQLGVDDLDKSIELSINEARGIFKGNLELKLDREHYVQMLQKMHAKDNGSSKAANDRRRAIEKLCRRKEWDLNNYLDLQKFLNSGLPKNIQSAVDNFDNELACLSKIWESAVVFREIEDVIKRIFKLAKQWLREYSDYKSERRILDYNDMERYFYKLLEMDEIKNEISGTYKCLMVDEFQDSSPLQVKIFDRLSELVESSYWCGDSKQAIYGFRGADTELTEAVVNMIPEGNIIPLDVSRRSVPDIVEFCNELFVKVFSDTLPEEKVKLGTWRPANQGVALMHWLSSQSSKSKAYDEIGAYVLDFKNKHSEVEWKDIAILAKTGFDINPIVESLHRYNIPVNYAGAALMECREAQLMQGLLTLMIDMSNPLAKAKIAYLASQGYGISKLIESRLENLNISEENEENANMKYEWLEDLPIIKRLKENSSEWALQNVSSLIITLINELNLRRLLKSWEGDWKVRERNLLQIANIAAEYESFSDLMGLGASTSGFLDYLEQSEKSCLGDDNGVVVSTCHASKGLQWPNVIVVSLEYDGGKKDKIVEREIFGIHEHRNELPTPNNLFPKMDILFLPWVFTSYALPGHIKEQIIESEVFNKARNKTIAESARLLYVAMTRARDRLITFSYRDGGRNSADPLTWLRNLNVNVCNPTESGKFDVFGTGMLMEVTATVDLGQEIKDGTNPRNYDIDVLAQESPKHARRNVSPSNVHSNDEAEVKVIDSIGSRIVIKGNPDMNLIGDCIHNAYAGFTDDDEYNLSVIRRIRHGFGFDDVMPDCDQVVAARRWLTNWLNSHYGQIESEYHELPFTRCVDGQVIRGSMDLVVRTANGLVLIDFKTFPGTDDKVTDRDSLHYAGRYKPQFDCYSGALTHAGQNVIAKLVFYPVSGLLVELED